MALVTTAINLTGDYVPYERPPQPMTLWTPIPRGLQSGISNGGILDAKPVNDDQALTCTMVLPPNFGYVMADAQLTIKQNRASDWEPECNVEFTNFYRAAVPISNGFEANYRQELHPKPLLGDVEKVMSVVQPWPTFPFVGTPGSGGAIVVLSAINGSDTVATAGTVMAFLSFWQFDLEQIRKFPINSPIPVHSR